MNSHRLFNYFTLSSIALAIVWFAAFPVSNDGLGLTALLVIFIMGMPHGALDIIMLKALSKLDIQTCNASYVTKLSVLVSMYTALVVVAFFAWMLIPTICLIVFLIIGIAHFRHDWQQTLSIPSWCLSGVVVTAPSLVYSQRLEDVFEWLFVPSYHASIIALVMQVIAMLCMATVLVYWLKNSIDTPVVKKMIIVVMCASVLPPLVFFTLYFCIVHSVYHTMLVQKTMQMNFRSLAVATLIPMLGTVALFSAAYWYFVETKALSVYFPLVFIGLFAVTCPHVLLTHLCSKVMVKAAVA